mmetsp:Transcript_7855/g.16541  ORF Transcript_7855/g.16541 Transcript_7855/m.16541 type:complete len:331 (-) Transcript_7855:224-1216(-)
MAGAGSSRGPANTARLEGRVRGRHEDAALAAGLRVAALDEDVAVHAPRRAPRVLHLPVVGTVGVGAVARGKDTVVERGTAAAGEDTTRVELEAELVGLDGDRDRLLGDGRHECLLALLDVGVARRGGARVRRAARDAGPGGAAARGVGVVRLLTEAAVAHDPLERGVHEAAVAARVSGVARHELLLRKAVPGRDVLVVRNGVGALEAASGREGPARAAAALVLHGGDLALVAPVERVRSIHALGELDRHLIKFGLVGADVEAAEASQLELGVCGELVDREGVRGARRVVGVDLVQALGEQGAALLVLGGGVLLLELGNELVELRRDVGFG